MKKRTRERVRRPRALRARPLLVGVGATVLLAGCGDPNGVGVAPPDLSAPQNFHDMGLTPLHDMAKSTTD